MPDLRPFSQDISTIEQSLYLREVVLNGRKFKVFDNPDTVITPEMGEGPYLIAEDCIVRDRVGPCTVYTFPVDPLFNNSYPFRNVKYYYYFHKPAGREREENIELINGVYKTKVMLAPSNPLIAWINGAFEGTIREIYEGNPSIREFFSINFPNITLREC